MNNALAGYKTLIFDCDGVVLDSNRVKTEAFYNVCLPYGNAHADALVAYHVANGGVSRYRKFRYFIEDVLRQTVTDAMMQDLLARYGGDVRAALKTCRIAEGLEDLRRFTQSSRWLLASGGDQQELREVFADRGIDVLFDGGIFGSPDSKDEIIRREIERSSIVLPALYLGDSKYDYLTAVAAGFDFVFVYGWTEFQGWKEYFESVDVSPKAQLKAVADVARQL